MAEVTLPQLGETVTEGTITRWFKQIGEAVALDEVLFEVSTDKVDSEVPSPVAGVLTEIRVAEGDTVPVGTVIAVVSADGAAPVAAPVEPAPAEAAEAPVAPEPPPPAAPAPAPAPAAAPPAPAPAAEPAPPPAAPPAGRLVSPVVRQLLREHAVDPAAVEATGPGGRITRADVERHIRATGATAITAPVGGAPPAPAPAPAPTDGGAPARPPTVVPFTNIRRRTAEHMALSKQTSPHAYSVIEVDYENVERVRRTVRDTWKAEEGFSLTYLPFIARAVIDALEEFPHLNATVGADELVVEPAVHLGIAVDLDFEGLLAPVVRDAESKRLRAIAREIVDLSGRARTKRLSIDEITGGTFTITNNGSFGTAIVLPIINQPQVGILSTDAITRKPVVVIDGDGGEAIAIHSVGMLALAWDHRAFDGSYAGAFLSHVKQILETRDWAAEL